MNIFKITKTWRIVALAVMAVIVLYALFNFLVLPRFTSWIMAQIPGSAAVKQALETEFPKYKVSISSNTNYGPDNHNQHTLTIGMSGSSFLANDELERSENIICSSLGQNAAEYNNIYLQNSVVHQYIVFYYSQGQSHIVTCK